MAALNFVEDKIPDISNLIKEIMLQKYQTLNLNIPSHKITDNKIKRLKI